MLIIEIGKLQNTLNPARINKIVFPREIILNVLFFKYLLNKRCLLHVNPDNNCIPATINPK